MWLESTVGVGSTFFFSLPLSPLAPLSADALSRLSPEWEFQERTRPSKAPRPLLRPRFVVLEPDGALQRLLTRYWHDAEIVAVTSPEEATAALSAEPAQALLVNSLSWSESLQHLSAAASLPYNASVVVCSVPNLMDAEGNYLGASDYLVKPISRDTLLAALKRLHLGGSGEAVPHTAVLIADDEPDAVQLYWRILDSAGQGYRVLTASDGHQALQTLAAEHPDVLLLDLVMPGMDGFQVLAAKNADPALRRIPTIVLSARDPAGHPLVSRYVAATRGEGLSLPQLLASIEALSAVLAPTPRSGDPGPTAGSPG
jgi:CheY-like chemotaxis protein